MIGVFTTKALFGSLPPVSTIVQLWQKLKLKSRWSENILKYLQKTPKWVTYLKQSGLKSFTQKVSY